MPRLDVERDREAERAGLGVHQRIFAREHEGARGRLRSTIEAGGPRTLRSVALPASFLTHLQTQGYNSRNSVHSRALCEAIVADLMAQCATIRSAAVAGDLVFAIDHRLQAAGMDEWKTDLAIGPPSPDFVRDPSTPASQMSEDTPIATRIAVEAKSTMTKHSGARKNRKRDLEAHHQHVHAYDERAVAAAISIAAVAVSTPALNAYRAQPSPVVRVLEAMTAETRVSKPGALAMHQTFVRPLEAEDVGITPQLPSPPRLEWLELVKYWKEGHTEPLWFLADPMRSDVALIDPASRNDSTSFTWPVVEHLEFGGFRPSAARWYRMPLPGWFAEDGWSLTPETAGTARVRGRGPHLGPITAMIRRRPNAARLMIGGRHLGSKDAPPARFTLSIDGAQFQQFDAAPGFFLKVFDVPAGRLTGDGQWATIAVQSTQTAASAPFETAIEQFDLQDDQSTMWGYGEGWQEAEFNQTLGVWRWTSEKSALHIIGPPRSVQITMSIESPLRYFDAAPTVKVKAGDREVATSTIDASKDWTFSVPADALVTSGGILTIETDRTFVPAERSGGADQRHLGLRVFAIRVVLN